MPEIKNIKISLLENNNGQISDVPKNPRIIKDQRFKDLIKSIQDDPEFLELRECIVYPLKNKFIIIAGNMRFQACKELGYKEIPCKILPAETSAKKLRAYSIKDNISEGEHDWNALSLDWDEGELIEFGMAPWNFGELNFDETPSTITQNIEDIKKIRELRKSGTDKIKEKTDTEKYLIIVFSTREEKQNLLKELNLPEDERYIPFGGVQIIPSGKWIQKFKSANLNKSGATG